MKKYKFQLEIFESDVDGDEFWEEATINDNTGIKSLTSAIKELLIDSNLFISSDRDYDDIVKLVEYKDE